MKESLCYFCSDKYQTQSHCNGRIGWCDWCSCPCNKSLRSITDYPIVEEINKENTMPSDYLTTNQKCEDEFSPYRCLAYRDEENSEVTDKIIISTSKDRARDLFAAELGTDKIKEGYTIKVFPMR